MADTTTTKLASVTMEKPFLPPATATAPQVPTVASGVDDRPHTTSSIDYVRGTSTIHTTDPDAPLTNARQDYVARRYTLFDSSGADASYNEIAMGAVSRLPLHLQVSFRMKMLFIFALQLLIVWGIVGVFRFHKQAKDMADKFFDPPVARLIIAFVAGLALLVALYFTRNKFPLNWLLLALFTCAQSFCFVGLGVVLDTNIGFFNCAFTFFCVVIIMALAGVRRRKPRHDAEAGDMDSQQGKLLSSFAAGAIAYVVVALVAIELFVIFGNEFVTDVGFGATLGFQCVLMLWFAYDASAMYKVMSPDEYMHGVIYFYTDLILLALIVVAAIGTVMAAMALAAACSDSGGGASCDCSGCSGCYYVPCDCAGCNCNSCGSSSRVRSQDQQQPQQEEIDRV